MDAPQSVTSTPTPSQISEASTPAAVTISPNLNSALNTPPQQLKMAENMQVQASANGSSSDIKKTPYDYKFIKLLGEGSFSSVYLAIDARENEQTGNVRKYAIKVCEKMQIKRHNKPAAIMREKKIMRILNDHKNPHFIRLYCTFQDVTRLYFVMTYADNGELLVYMQKNRLTIPQVKRYTKELLAALEHLHQLGIVHRDLKPENILLDQNMSILITDFGSAQIYPNLPAQGATLAQSDADRTSAVSDQNAARRNSFVGTAQYVSPEMLKSRQATSMSDIWAFGIIIYQMITNIMPFNAPNEWLIYQKILSLDYEFPNYFDPEARDLVSSLIQLDPIDRLGANDNLHDGGYKSIRAHSFISSFKQDEHSDQLQIKPSSPQDMSQYDNIEPGLDEAHLLRLLTSF